MILLDTSVWTEVFRKPRGLDLEAIVDLGEVRDYPRLAKVAPLRQRRV